MSSTEHNNQSETESILLNINDENKKKNGNKPPKKKESRSDAYGTLINHKNSKCIKVTFKDQIENNNHFAEVIEIESYKLYNKLHTSSPLNDYYVRDGNCCSSCNLV